MIVHQTRVDTARSAQAVRHLLEEVLQQEAAWKPIQQKQTNVHHLVLVQHRAIDDEESDARRWHCPRARTRRLLTAGPATACLQNIGIEQEPSMGKILYST